MRRKGTLPVPYIVALIIAVIVIVVILIWFYGLSIKGTTTGTDAFCRAREFTYCSQWAASGYSSTSMPGADGAHPNGKLFCCGTDSYANECSSISWATQVGQSECKSILGQGGQTSSATSTQ